MPENYFMGLVGAAIGIFMLVMILRVIFEKYSISLPFDRRLTKAAAQRGFCPQKPSGKSGDVGASPKVGRCILSYFLRHPAVSERRVSRLLREDKNGKRAFQVDEKIYELLIKI